MLTWLYIESHFVVSLRAVGVYVNYEAQTKLVVY